MNRTSKELATQSGAIFHPAENDKRGYLIDECWDTDDFDIERYTELIVRKCIEFSENPPLNSYGTPMTAAEYIKEQFGLEE